MHIRRELIVHNRLPYHKRYWASKKLLFEEADIPSMVAKGDDDRGVR